MIKQIIDMTLTLPCTGEWGELCGENGNITLIPPVKAVYAYVQSIWNIFDTTGITLGLAWLYLRTNGSFETSRGEMRLIMVG